VAGHARVANPPDGPAFRRARAVSAFARASLLPVTWYSRTSAMGSHIMLSLLPDLAGRHRIAVCARRARSGTTVGSLATCQRKKRSYVRLSEPQSMFFVLQTPSGTHMCHKPFPL